MKWIFFVILILTAFYDWFTSLMGTIFLLDAKDPLVYGLAVVVSLACIAINFMTRTVWSEAGIVIRGIWVVLMAYDLLTTAVGVGNVARTGSFFDYYGAGYAIDGFWQNVAIAAPITFIVVVSPILATWVLSSGKYDDLPEN